MQKSIFWIIFVTVIITGCNFSENSPNIIFIMSDDLGYGDQSCYGAEKIHTHNVDQIDSERVMFIDAHSPE